MAVAPVEYIKSITRQYAELGYKPYGWVYNTDVPPWQPLRKRCGESWWITPAPGKLKSGAV